MTGGFRVEVEEKRTSSTWPGQKRRMLRTDSGLTAGQEITVVLVDDDVSVADMYRLGLERHGFQVTIARGGDDLVESLNTDRPPDIIVLDYELSRASGFQVLDMIRRDARTKAARTFILTNFPPTEEGTLDRALRLGAIAWLDRTKMSPNRLAHTLAEAVGRSGMRARANQPQSSRRGGAEFSLKNEDAVDALRLRVGHMDNLEELSGWLGASRARLRLARSTEEVGVEALVTELESRYRQRRAELA